MPKSTQYSSSSSFKESADSPESQISMEEQNSSDSETTEQRLSNISLADETTRKRPDTPTLRERLTRKSDLLPPSPPQTRQKKKRRLVKTATLSPATRKRKRTSPTFSLKKLARRELYRCIICNSLLEIDSFSKKRQRDVKLKGSGICKEHDNHGLELIRKINDQKSNLVGFGKHADFSYIQVRVIDPEHCEWVKQEYRNNTENCSSLVSFAEWLLLVDKVGIDELLENGDTMQLDLDEADASTAISVGEFV